MSFNLVDLLSKRDRDNTEWEGYPYAPISKAARATLVADRIERGQSPSFYKFKPIQLDLI